LLASCSICEYFSSNRSRVRQIRNIRRAYRVLYRSGLKLQAALEELETAAASQEEIRPFVDFIKRSSRSLVR